MGSPYMRSKGNSQQLLLGLGAAGLVAVASACALLHAVTVRRRRPAYSKTEWLSALDEIGTIRGFDDIVNDVADRGVEASIRPQVWPFLLEVFDHASTYEQRQRQHQIMVRQYQQLLLQCQAYEAAWKDSLRPSSPHTAAPAAPSIVQQHQQQQSRPPSQQHVQQQHQQLHLPEQIRQFAEAHRIIVIDSVRTDFQRHRAALADMQDQDGSSYLSSFLNSMRSSSLESQGSVGGLGSSFAANTGMSAVANIVSQGLSHLQQHWLGSLLGGQAAEFGHQQALWVSEAAHLVLKNSGHMVAESKRQAARMIAMLSAYALHDPDTGYCQGMSDLLLPFLLLMEDDALAFWCFVALMQQSGVRRNFAVDESGIFAQLRSLQQVLEATDKPLMFRLHQLGAAECHFAYRMTIVMMRRDLPLHQVMLLWEVLWARAWHQRHRSHQQQLQEVNCLPAAGAQLDSPRSTGSAGSIKHYKAVADGGTIKLMADSRSSSRCSSRAQLHADRVPELFICFVAAVIISQRRHVLDHCYDADDVLRLFHGLKQIDLWHCLKRAQELQHEISYHALS